MNSKSETPLVADYDDGGRVVFANDDLLTEILLQLPAKSVIRFTSVCKHWLSLISDDHFRRLHTFRRNKPQPSLIYRFGLQFFYCNRTVNGESLIIPYSFSVPNPKILSSCNGMLLLRRNIPQTHDYYVYNPATKRTRIIILDYDVSFPRVMGINLAFDPSKSPHYKIVCVRATEGSHYALTRLHKIDVYDSMSHTWKVCVDRFATDTINVYFSFGVHRNNSIDWYTFGAHYMYFDIDKNIMGSLSHPEIPWPEHPRNEFCRPRLQESNGHLYHFLMDAIGKSVVLWELQEDDHSQWLLKYYDHPLRMFGRPFNLLRFIRGSDGEETSALVTYIPGKIRAYRFLDKSMEELVDYTNQPLYVAGDWCYQFCDVHQFGESLALV